MTNMGPAFTGTGEPPYGYKVGDPVEFLGRHGWIGTEIPAWSCAYEYRLPADHPFYHQDTPQEIPSWTRKRRMELTDQEGAVDYAAKLAMAFQRYIAQHEQEPVDPDVELAREVAADVYEAIGFGGSAEIIHEGAGDHNIGYKTALAAIKRVRESVK